MYYITRKKQTTKNLWRQYEQYKPYRFKEKLD